MQTIAQIQNLICAFLTHIYANDCTVGEILQKATIKDVAKLAKVSPSTVSRVLSGNPSISDDTCKRVKNAVKELHYTPNTTARSLRCENSKSIVVVFPYISG